MLVQLRKSALWYGYKRGLGQQAEDFAQYAVLKRIEGSTSNIHILYVDYMRMVFGRGDSPTSKARAFAERTFSDMEEEEYHLADDFQIEDTALIFKVFPKGKDRAIILLKVIHDFRLSELGYLFGVSESAMCGKLKRLYAILREKLGDQDDIA